MNPIKLNPRRRTLILLCLFPLYGLWHLWETWSTSVVVVENRSGAPLRQVRISLVGIEHTVPELAAGGQTRIRVQPESRSGLSLTYQDAQGREQHWDQGYVGTGNYRVHLRVNPDHSVTMQTTGRL